MKTTLSLALLVLAVTAVQASDTSLPPLEDCTQIRIATDDYAWMMDFKSDGTGRFQYGSLGMDGGGFAKGKVDFARLYKALALTFDATKPGPTISNEDDDGQRKRRFRVAFEFRSKPGQYVTGYTQETDAIEQAFKKGFDALDPHVANCLEYLLLVRDPFHGPLQWLRLKTPVRRAAMVKDLEGLVKEMSPKERTDSHEQIAFNTRAGWKLLINADGSGELSIGRHASLTAKFGVATFDYGQVYETQVRQPAQEMLRSLQGEPRAAGVIPRQGAIVSVKVPDQPPRVVTASPQDPSSVKELFGHAWESATLPKEAPTPVSFLLPISLKAAWETRPPIELESAPK